MAVSNQSHRSRLLLDLPLPDGLLDREDRGQIVGIYSHEAITQYLTADSIEVGTEIDELTIVQYQILVGFEDMSVEVTFDQTFIPRQTMYVMTVDPTVYQVGLDVAVGWLDVVVTQQE